MQESVYMEEEPLLLDETFVHRSYAYQYRMDGTEKENQSNFFMRIHSNYLTLREGDVFNNYPYNPHRFNRQLGFIQDSPGRLDQDCCEASLEDGLRLASFCALTKSMKKATFPPSGYNMKFSSQNYKSWWEKVHENLLENNVQFLVNVIGLVTYAL